VASSTATCPAGSYVVGGGYATSAPADIVAYSARVTTTTFGVIAVNYFPTTATVQAQAICASGPGIQASRVPDGSPGELQAQLDRFRAKLAG
jgi:hypothetical protein